MSKHNIHGLDISVRVLQGNLTERSRAACVGKVVNMCREMDAAEFVSNMRAMQESLQGSAASAAMLGVLDSALAAGYTKRYDDEFAPIASLSIVES